MNNYVIAQGGGTLIFDVLVESYSTPSAGLFSQIAVFTSDTNFNYAAYNFGKGAFTAGEGTNWITADQTSNFNCYVSRDYKLEKNTWYEMAFQFNGNEVIIYLDGVPMVATTVDKVEHKYFILYPQFCTVLIDNIRVCGKDYNVRDRYGDVNTTADFKGITSVSAISAWDFDSTYTISQNGRPMTGIGDMLPKRTVAPSISGNYLQYKESGGSGIATLNRDFTNYNGFVYVEDIRVDRKSVGANFSVRFGSNYIAGYDWDNACFKIGMRSGYGFSTSAAYNYAVADYTLEMGTTYEFAVRQVGSLVCIYLNGVMITSATNDSFVAGFNNIQINHYRLGASIDNVVIAYSDYDVKEASGNPLNKFTFIETDDYLNDVCGLNIGTAGYGYSVVKGGTVPVVSVDSVEAVDGSATVGVSLSNCPGYDAFELSIAYDSAITVSDVKVKDIPGGVSAVSPTTANPIVVACVTDGTGITDADILDITFSVPEGQGEYDVTVTVTPYINDVPVTVISGTGSVTVPRAALTYGKPDGLYYDGEYVMWNPMVDADYYEVYVLYRRNNRDREELIDTTGGTDIEFYFEDYYSNDGEYKIVVKAYDPDCEVMGISDPISLIYVDGVIYTNPSDYADVLYDQLLDLIDGREYSDANQDVVDGILDEAYDALSDADYATMLTLYDQYYAELDAVPTGDDVVVEILRGDANGDGTVNSADVTLVSRKLAGASVELAEGADYNDDGAVNSTDLVLVRRHLVS